ncbi:MAG: hypothetical protein AAF658_22510 [Myxococcota bacterium]
MRAIVAKSVGRSNGAEVWKGVWNNWGSQPNDLGNFLLRECERRGGDLSGLIRDVIDSVPGGWSKLQKGTRAPDYSWPPYHGPEELEEFADVIDYLYIFRPADSRLDVYRVNREDDSRRELVASVQFDETGKADRSF